MTNSADIPEVRLPSGEAVVALGLGTWGMGDDRRRRSAEVAALRLGLDLGMTLVDTAEMYGDGGAEEIVGEAVAGRREDVFLVSKVLPDHATHRGTIAACHASLKRLRTDRLDLYLLHWRERVPLAETIAAFHSLVQAGDIRYWGVSNFDTGDMKELEATTGGGAVATNQVLYNLARRGIEFDLLPWCGRRKLPVMAYLPIDQARLLANPALRRVGARLGATPAQIALAWVIRAPGVIAIPKAANEDHLRENRRAIEIRLTENDLAELDGAFPPPAKKVPLEML
jgi:diketogulonate reductase-like aldo/keto reductase